jgi:hypothetical protein
MSYKTVIAWTPVGEFDPEWASQYPTYFIQCPACVLAHGIPANYRKFNGDYYSPTFDPGILIEWENLICKFSITDGHIKYHEDSSHRMGGQTVPLPPAPKLTWLHE